MTDQQEPASGPVVNEWMCNEHGTVQIGETPCAPCLELIRTRRAVSELTLEERCAAIERLGPQLTIPFDNLHQWMTELMGRDVWTHELAYPEQLLEELRNGERIGLADVIAKLPWDKPVILTDGTNAGLLP